MFYGLANDYGTSDGANEPQEIFGCYCSDSDNCNVKYDNIIMSSTNVQEETTATMASGLEHMKASPLICFFALVINFRI